MKKKNIIPIISVLLVFSLFINYKLLVLNKHYKGLIPYLMEGEMIGSVDLIDKYAQPIDKSQLTKGVSIIFVFLKECSSCDKSILFWEKIAKLFDKKISITGVVLNSPTDAFNFAKEAKLNFSIYVPDDLPSYTHDMRMLLNQSQTIVLQDGRVKKVKLGALDAVSAVDIINTIKGLLK